MNGMFCDIENIKKLVDSFEKQRKDHSLIVLIRTKDLESVNLNKIPSNVYFIPDSHLNFGELYILKNELKDNAWSLIQKGEINFKRGEVDGMQAEMCSK